MAFTVTAECVLAKDQSGQIHHKYKGDRITWLSADQKAHFLSEKLVEESDSSGSDSDEAGPPAKAATKDAWVAWAVKASADTDEPLTDETADEYSKADLVELFG